MAQLKGSKLVWEVAVELGWSCTFLPSFLQEGCVWDRWLPADGQQANDNNGRGELVHALLDDNAVNGPASVVGQEGLTCGGTGQAQRGAHSHPLCSPSPRSVL